MPRGASLRSHHEIPLSETVRRHIEAVRVRGVTGARAGPGRSCRSDCGTGIKGQLMRRRGSCSKRKEMKPSRLPVIIPSADRGDGRCVLPNHLLRRPRHCFFCPELVWLVKRIRRCPVVGLVWVWLRLWLQVAGHRWYMGFGSAAAWKEVPYLPKFGILSLRAALHIILSITKHCDAG